MADEKSTILLVEDDTFLVDMYSRKFADYGYAVITASNGKQALEHIKTKKPNIILMDVVMPEMDGFETLKAIKSDASMKDVPVIMLTNLGQKEEVEKALQMGASDYLIKAHFTPTEVANKVKEFIASHS
jgi:DNA-binding response OmpR family regulator